jgi:acyl-CoA synthetase (AMP-forming)/AMP-acid ligase II
VTIVSALQRIHRTTPHRVLVHHPASGQALDAAAIWNLHLHYVDVLRASGLRSGQVIVSVAGNCPGFVALVVACRALLVALVPVDGSATVPEILELATRLDAAALVLADGIAIPDLPAAAFGGGLVLAMRHPAADATHIATALMKVTSGSTGAARTTRTTEEQLVADCKHITEGMRIGPDDTQIGVIPLSHSYGFSSLVMPLLMLGTPAVLRESFVPSQIAADARAFGARVFPGVPFMFHSLLDEPPADGWPPALRTLISAGAALPTETASRFIATFGVKIRSFYGTSETGGIAFNDSDDLEACDSIGRPLPGVTVILLPEDDLSAGAGRIFVRSAAVSDGYSSGSNDGFREGGYLTGDYGTFDEQGRVVLIGRVSSFINVAGRKVEPGEVERVLRLLPGVRDVYVFAAADPRRGEHVVACLVGDPGLTTLAVRQFCAGRLAPHKVPRAIRFVAAIPRTIRGKVDVRALDAFVAMSR